MRHYVALEIVAHRIRIPVGGIEQALDAIGSTLAEGFSELPAILALDRSEQTIEIAAGTGPHFRASEARRDHGIEDIKGGGTGKDNHDDRLLSVPRSLPSKCGCSIRVILTELDRLPQQVLDIFEFGGGTDPDTAIATSMTYLRKRE
jgi:hypothetical protein